MYPHRFHWAKCTDHGRFGGTEPIWHSHYDRFLDAVERCLDSMWSFSNLPQSHLAKTIEVTWVPFEKEQQSRCPSVSWDHDHQLPPVFWKLEGLQWNVFNSSWEVGSSILEHRNKKQGNEKKVVTLLTEGYPGPFLNSLSKFRTWRTMNNLV